MKLQDYVQGSFETDIKNVYVFAKRYANVVFYWTVIANIQIFDPQILCRLQIASGGRSTVVYDGRGPTPVVDGRWWPETTGQGMGQQ